jgi:DNA-directed RNA polymerase subunit beta
MTPCEEDNSPESKLIRALYYQDKKEEPRFRDTSLKVPHGTEGRVIDVRVISTPIINKEETILSTSSQHIRIFIAQIRKLKMGDKLAGRHGNKGIVSRILSRQDMPYLPDGTPIDILFNPLGVPSRMNVGQVFECLLGLAGEKIGKRYKVSPFDEIYGTEASRVLVNQKLKEASLKTNSNWLFNPYYQGKILLRDGRTGEFFDNPILVGKSYILKLIHLVEDKIHARATGPYSMITEQPLAGKSQKGGQRFGEMEVWALEAYGCSNTLQELLTIKSDDIDGRNDMYESILIRKELSKPSPSIPESFLALMRELHSLGLDFSLKKFEGGFYSTTNIKEVEKDIFKELEIRLKLRALLARKKVEEYAKNNVNEKLESKSKSNTKVK